MTRLKGSGLGGKYSFEASPLVKDGIMYVVTGNDDVFALNAKTGEIIWEYWSGIDQKISTVCCGWVNRGLAMGEGLLFFGQLDANVVALDMKTGKVAWKTPIEKWENGYGITSAPLYYDGIVYSGITGGEFGVRGRLTALDAKTGEILWRWYTLPGPGEFGSDTWPAGTDHTMRGGATIWNTPALDPELGLVYFAIGNCGPGLRRLDARGRQPVLRLDGRPEGQDGRVRLALPAGAPRHLGLRRGEPGRPVRHRDQRPAAQGDRRGRPHRLGLHPRPHQRQAADRHRREAGAAGSAAEDGQDAAVSRVGDATVPQCAELLPGYEKAGCIFEPFWETPVLIQPSGIGGTNWSPMPYSPDTGYFYVPGTVRTSAFTRYSDKYMLGLRYTGGTQSAPIGSPMSGTFTAIDSKTNKIAWQHKTPYRIGGGGGSTVTAGGLVFRGEPDGNFLALDAKTGQELWRFQTGFGADAPPVVYEVDGEQFVAIATGGNQLQGSAYGDAVWVFSLKGQLRSAVATASAARPSPGPTGPIVAGCRHGQDGRQQRGVQLRAGAHPDQGGHDGDLHQRRRSAALRRRRWTGASGTPGCWSRATRRPSPSRSPATTTTSARRTPGCTARSSWSSERDGRAYRRPLVVSGLVALGLLAVCVAQRDQPAAQLAPPPATGALQALLTTSELVVGQNRFAFGLMKDGTAPRRCPGRRAGL